jgi:hypothetical protein
MPQEPSSVAGLQCCKGYLHAVLMRQITLHHMTSWTCRAHTCCTHAPCLCCRLPDQVDFDSSSARREWKLGRSAAGEVLVSSAGVLGPDAALLLLVGPLEPALAAGDWRTAEVALHGMR